MKKQYERLAYEFSVWAWGKSIPSEISELEKFFLRFLKETKKI